MPGTNVKTFFAVFDVSSEDTNAVGKYLGLRISNVSFGFSDGLNDGFAQNSFISEFNHGPDFATNICISALTARDWDFKIISSANCAPVSIGISNLYALSYFDIVGDGENTSTEKITNITVGLYGKKSDLAGDLLLYRDTNIVSVLSNHDKLTGSNAVSAPSVAGFSLNESGISTDPLNPDRFWIGIYITNHAAGIYTNTVLANITNVLCSGPNNGILTNFEILTNVSTNYSRIDNYLVYASASNVLSSSVEQGSFNNVAFALRLSNSDPDAQYYFNSLRVTNTGTATNSDLGSFQLFRDNGDGVFSSALDTVIANASSLTGKEYILSFTPQIITNDLLWGLFNVDFSSAVNNTVALAVAGASGSNVLGFYDNFSDNYSLLPTCSAPAQIPASPYSAVIIPYSSKPYDFYLFSLDYSSMPQSFTSNQYIQAAAMEVFMDTEQPDQQYFTGLDVNLGSTKSSNQIFGIADLYKESSGNTTFSIADTLLASTNIAAGGSFSLSLSNSNITSSTDQPDRLYLVFRLTNNVELAKTNTVFFKITNIYCSGPNGGVFTNKQLLTNFSREARIDNGKVIVNYITNYQEPAKPKQASFNNIFLKMSLQGDDPDGTNYISHVDVKSNNSSSVNFAFGHIPYVKIFDASKTVLSYQSFTGCERITLNPPVALAGTNETILYAGYDVSSSSSVVSNTFGMELTNNSIGLVDNISDNFSQYIWSAGSYSGPSPVSNVTIASISSQPWDIYIQNAVNAAPKSIRVSNVYGMTYVEVIADSQESMIAQKITNFKVALEGYCSEVKGQLLLYRDTNDANNMSAYSFSTNDCLLLTNIYFSDYQATNNLVSFQSNLSGTATEPTRFWIGLKLTNYENNIYTNKIRIRTVDIEASGPDNGIVTNKNILTYSSAALANVDSYQLNLYAQSTNTNNSVKQGSFNNLAFRMVFVNSDTDATNYFSGMIITNVGITGASGVSNLGDFRLFRDDGDNIYSPSQDIVQGSASLNNESYSISLFTPAVLSGTSNVFWGVYDVKLDASTNMANYISLQIPSVSVTNNISFADQIIDSYGDYYQVPVLLTSGPYPAVTCSNSISPFNSLPFDFYLSEASYSAAPDAFTSNQYAPLGQIKVFRDLDNNPNLAFRGMDVQVNGSKANVSGEAFIYREASGTGFSTNTDEYICMTNVYSGNAFSLDCNMTNITMNVDSPDTLYLVFRLTNDIDTAKGDKFSFRITNLRVTGTDNVITNLSLLSSAAAKESRIDSFKVIVEYVSNNIEYYKPSVLLNPVNYLKIGIRGDDSDAVNYLSSLTINTNGLSDIDSDTISYIKLYTNSSGGSLKETFFSNSYGTFNLSPPLAVNGSTMQELFIKYDISTASNSVGKKFGMEIRSNAWGFTDYISDNFSQNSFVSGSYAGPAFTTNILIISPAVKWWDFEAIESAKNEAPTQLVEGVEVPVMSFKMYRENETPGDSATWEYLTNITVSNVLNDYAFSGILKLYTNKASVDNWKSASQLSTNVLVSSGLPAVSFDFAKAYISYNAAESTRFYITYTAQNFHSAAQNSFKVLSIGSGGPNDGIINNSSGIIGFISEPIRCENRNIKIECTSYLPEKAKQGQKKVPALRMVINSIDADASFQLNSLYFDLGGTFGTNDLEKGLIYLDNGDTPGSLDDKDVFVDGSAGIFSSGKMQATFSTPMAITSTPKKLLLLLDIGEEAIIGNSFNVSFKKENQKGFAALTIDNTAYALTLGDYSPDTTGYCSILPGIQFKNKFTPAAASTVIDIAKNGKCQIYLSDELDYTAYKAAIFDVFGHKINDLAFPSHKLEWGGADFKGSVVRSGIYIIIVIGPDIHESFKVMVIK
ncbi:MAG: hypothetical protein A2096_05665 [Spirochaetes bacterium GWF1_41_5]|nr:MAG: hypothetical protein A2096_05665 [Spirochaetes bacterium GWF1_41_5]